MRWNKKEKIIMNRVERELRWMDHELSSEDMHRRFDVAVYVEAV